MSVPPDEPKLVARDRPTVKNVLLCLMMAVFAVGCAILLVVLVTAEPPSWGRAVVMVLGVLLFGLGGIIYGVRMLGGRPLLVLDRDGVHLYPPWPRSRTSTVSLPWRDLTAVIAWKQQTERVRTPFLTFVPTNTDPENLGEILGEELAKRSAGQLRYAVQITAGVSASMDDISRVVAAYRPDVPVHDRRG